MTLLINYETFLNSENGQVYPLELPNYFVINGTLTIEQYYQKVMLNTQIIINNYCQNVLSKAQWDLDSFSNSTKESIIQILVAEFIYLHENQLFFKKTNDIQYSTAGQQTFTFSPELDKSASYFVPENVKKMIENAGILNFSSSILNQGFNTSQASNQFLDGILVPEVRWDSKANASFILNGANQDVIDYLIFLSSDYISKTNPQWLQLIQNVNLFTLLQNKISSIYILTAPNIYPNKGLSDYAQVDDIVKTYNVINANVQNNTNDITNLTSIVEDLDSNKVSQLQLNNSLQTKANINLNNVSIGAYPVARSVIVDTNGNIQFSTAGGAIFDITQWDDTITYVAGRMVFVFGSTPTLIWIATNKAGNKNKNPFTENTFWQQSNLNIDLTNYFTKNETTTTFLNKTGNIATMATNLDMSGYAITNANNLLDDSIINDSIISTTNLWSSKKTNDVIENAGTTIKDYVLFSPWEFKQNFAKSSNFTYDDHFIGLATMKQFGSWAAMYTALNMTPEEIAEFENANVKPTPDVFPDTPSTFAQTYFGSKNDIPTAGTEGLGIMGIVHDYQNPDYNNTLLSNDGYLTASNYTTTRFSLNNTMSTSPGYINYHKGGGGNTTGRFPVVSGFWDASPTQATVFHWIQLNFGTQTAIRPQRIATTISICYRKVVVKVPL